METVELSQMATRLLGRMIESPGSLRYDTKVLPGMFRPGDLFILDAAYEELKEHGLIERAPGYASFFGTPKPFFRLTDKGRRAEFPS